MDETTIEVIERPSTPAEARLHHDLEGLRRAQDMLTEWYERLAQRVHALELLRRPGDD